MLKYNLNKLFHAKGISNKVPFLEKAGINRNAASRIINNKYKTVPLDYIEKMCVAFHCTPNDLLEWNPKEDQKADESHPLFKLLNSGETVYDLRNLGQNIPYEKLNEFGKKVDELKKEILAGK